MNSHATANQGKPGKKPGHSLNLNGGSSPCCRAGGSLYLHSPSGRRQEKRFSKGSRFSAVAGLTGRAAGPPRRAWDCRSPRCRRRRCFPGRWASRRLCHPNASRSPDSGWRSAWSRSTTARCSSRRVASPDSSASVPPPSRCRSRGWTRRCRLRCHSATWTSAGPVSPVYETSRAGFGTIPATLTRCPTALDLVLSSSLTIYVSDLLKLWKDSNTFIVYILYIFCIYFCIYFIVYIFF